MKKILLGATPESAPYDLRLSVFVSPGLTYQRSNLLLARAHFSGTFQFLTAAWERLLGYEAHEFVGKTLRQLIVPAAQVAARAVDAILDEANMAPVDVEVRCRDGRISRLKLHRRFDPHEQNMYIVAHETQEIHPG